MKTTHLNILILLSLLIGGYNFPNAARYWSYLTAIICNAKEKLAPDVPDNKYFLRYGPSYELTIARKNLDDQNTTNEMDSIYQTIQGGSRSYIRMRLKATQMFLTIIISVLFFSDNLRKYNVIDC